MRIRWRWTKGFSSFAVTLILFLTILLPLFTRQDSVVASGENWYSVNWLYRKLITINESKIISTLTNFPVLIYRSADTDLASDAQDDGDDICFVKYSDNTTKLNHEIETFSGSTGALNAWVNITSLSGTVDTKIWMYYGNPTCSSQQNKYGTWNSNFKAVYHLSSTNDSTMYKNNATNYGASSVAGKTGNAYDFEFGDADYMDVPNSASINITGNLTLSAWSNIESIGASAYAYILEKHGPIKDDNDCYDLIVRTSTMFFEWAPSYYEESATKAHAVSNWWYFGMTFSFVGGTSTLRWYQDGVNYDNDTDTHNLLNYTGGIYIGAQYETGGGRSGFWDGIIDEIRIENVVRNSSWMSACYNTINSPTTFHFFGAEELRPNSAPAITASSQNPVNQSTNVYHRLSCNYSHFNITVSDVNDATQNMNITWRTNESGSWKTMGTNTSVNNGTYYCNNVSWVDTYSTKYWWQIQLNDGCGGWDNETYYFTTAPTPSIVYVDDDFTSSTSGWGYTRFNTIHNATKNVTSGGYVYLWAGSYTTPKSYALSAPVHLIGNGTSDVTVKGTIDSVEGINITIRVSANNVEISGFTFDDAQSIKVSDRIYHDITIHHNAFYMHQPTHCIEEKGYNNLIYNNTFERIEGACTEGIMTSMTHPFSPGYVKIYNNTFTNFNNAGIWVFSTEAKTIYIYNNTFENNNKGMLIQETGTDNYINITENSFRNGTCGIYVKGTIRPTTLIYNNMFINNTEQTNFTEADPDPNIKFNISKTLGTNILGNPYFGGNYWDDYTGISEDGDYLGDTPYEIKFNETVWINDTLPLVYSEADDITISNPYPTNGSTFSFLDNIDDGAGFYYNVWCVDNYIYVACGYDGLRAYSFDGIELSLLGEIDDGGTYWDVYGNGSYIYVTMLDDGIRAYSFDGSSFTLLDSIDDGGRYNNVWANSSYIYTAIESTGIRAYSFDGSFNLIATKNQSNKYYGVWSDGIYIYVSNLEYGISAYTFNGTNFTLASARNAGVLNYGIWGDGDYIYVASFADGLLAYSFNGTNFTFINSNYSHGYYYDVWGDGTNIYTSCDEGGIIAYTFNGTNFTLLNSSGEIKYAFNIFGDEEYIYVASESSGLNVFAFDGLYELTPRCRINISNTDGGLMNLYFYENSTGTFVLRQTNLTCVNGTYTWVFTQALEYNTTYYWMVSVNDSVNNVSEIYHFTTRSLTWNTISFLNGTIYNITGVWTIIDSTLNGTIYNRTSTWLIIDSTLNGSIYNKTALWSVIYSTLNGTVYNYTAPWHVISSTINGSIYNISIRTWHVIDSTLNGTVYNRTAPWTIISFSLNGNIYNTTLWRILQPYCPGETWYDSDWSYRKLITINESKVGTTLTNFPVLIYRSADTDLASDAQDDGDDICFVKYSDNTTKLNHEIETFSGSTGALNAWVNITSLSGTVDTKIWMYYGNPTCSSQQNKYGTWDTNFVMVHHFDETTGTKVNDSTSYKMNGTKNAGVTLGATGIVGKCVDNAKASSGKITGVTSFSTYSTWTCEMWTQLDPNPLTAGWGDGISMGTATYEQWALQIGYTGLYFGPYNSGQLKSTSQIPATGTAWGYEASEHTATDTYVFYNGTQENTNTQDKSISGSWVFMASITTGEFTDGRFDELRVSKVARNASWVGATYNTISSPTTFHFFGAEEESVSSCDINGTIYNTSERIWTVIDSSLNGTIYNRTAPWTVVDSTLNGSIYNTSISTWQVIDSTLNGSIYNKTALWSVIYSTLNGTVYNYTAPWKVIDSTINGSIYNISIRTWHVIDSTLNGTVYNRTATWHIIDSSLNGTIYNQTAWNEINNTINGSIYNRTSTWKIIDSSLNGSIYNASVNIWQVIDSTINGTIYNTSERTWTVIDSSLNGTIYNRTATWSLIDTTINGSIYNITNWSTIDATLNGSIYNFTSWHEWSINGTIYNRTETWTILDSSINGTIYNASVSIWQVIDPSMNGTIYNRTSTWLIIDSSLNGSIYNTSNWIVIDSSLNGTIYNRTATWTIIDQSLNGTIYNTSERTWTVIDSSLNGTIYNRTATWTIIDDTLNGSVYNISISNWFIIDSSLNGTIYNQTAWNEINNTINGSIHNLTSWIEINNTINGTVYNLTQWHGINDTNNGTIYNLTTWKDVDISLNGTIYNTSVNIWNTIDDTINGSIYNTSSWIVIDSSLNGSIYNTSTVSWTVINSTINGTIYNRTAPWTVVDSTLNGSIYNTSISTWQVIDSSLNGSIYNFTSWNEINNTINGSIYNISVNIWNTIDDTINGSIYNTSSWIVIDSSLNGSIYNTSTVSWTVIDASLNGSIYNISISGWAVIDSSLNGIIYNGSWTIITSSLNGTIYNISAIGNWTVITSSINGTVYNISVGIFISNEYPVNGSLTAPANVTVHITIFDTYSVTMNITWWGSSNNGSSWFPIGTTNNAPDGTYGMWFSNASVVGKRYYWRVNVTDSIGNYANETYHFNVTTTALGGLTIIGGGNDRFVYGLALGAIFMVPFGILLMRRRRRRRMY